MKKLLILLPLFLTLSVVAQPLPPPNTNDYTGGGHPHALTFSANVFDIFGLDYWGPVVSMTNGGDATFHTILNEVNTCYSNYCGVQNLSSNQAAWFELRLSPDRDRTNRHGAVIAYRTGVCCGNLDVASVWYLRVGLDTSFQLLSEASYGSAASAVSLGQYPTITTWSTTTVHTFAGTNDVVMLFRERVG